MTKLLLASIIGAVLVLGVMFAPLLTQNIATADKIINNKCKIDKDTGTCVFDQTYKSKNQKIIVKNEIDASAIAQAQSGGNGNGGTVDLEARAAVESLEGRVNVTEDRIDQTNTRIDASDVRITNAETNITDLSANATRDFQITDQRIGQLADLSNVNVETDANQTAEIARLWEAVNEAITDIEPGTNQTGPGPIEPPVEPVEPVDNQTGDNTTGPIEPAPEPAEPECGPGEFLNMSSGLCEPSALPPEPVDNQTDSNENGTFFPTNPTG